MDSQNAFLWSSVVMILLGIVLVITGTIPSPNLIIRGWKIRLSGVFLLVPIMSLFALRSYDPLLFPPFYFGILGPVYERLDHVYDRASWLVPLGLSGAIICWVWAILSIKWKFRFE
jgi:hypothetical protein